ncbi:hypothetical protein [Shouchella hunanensis]|uniref:Uncharacterized protein n=1 Tax=Shouchella hunanensis TaxID=766894 RepID=A0ABY7W348_9BACI|nr:hypothetical protein [Shouchella hunanensis]WDF02322.1 hypothetical protein PQ477_12395 [Shouchella hunanensis]GAF20667.1 hypothetical protein JCM19047_318 [Bacillus sp. JCM 19047]
MKKNRKTMENQLLFLLTGLFVTGVAIYITINQLLNRQFPMGLALMALGVNQLLMVYLSPHLFPKDERAKTIIGKSMVVNYFVIFGSIFLLFFVAGFSGIHWGAQQVLIFLAAILLVTIPSTMVFYARRI